MGNLERITTDYSEQEDRISIAGLTDKDQTLVLWLTMTLASRLIKHCLSLLEKDDSELGKGSNPNSNSGKRIQHFVQKSAEEQRAQETAVKVSRNSPSYLVIEIDIKGSSSGVTLSFKEQFSSCYEIFLNSQQLRQWLGMLYTVWQKTEWPKEIWPDWMVGGNSQPTSGEISVH
tara:strand:+ start:2286 stop:2807 length:522 start_codon:yes stop_codon:yes gene_type:complete